MFFVDKSIGLKHNYLYLCKRELINKQNNERKKDAFGLDAGARTANNGAAEY